MNRKDYKTTIDYLEARIEEIETIVNMASTGFESTKYSTTDIIHLKGQLKILKEWLQAEKEREIKFPSEEEIEREVNSWDEFEKVSSKSSIKWVLNWIKQNNK